MGETVLPSWTDGVRPVDILGAGGSAVVDRVRQREGVEIERSRGISSDAAACVKKLLKNKAVGAPTSDPVGVTLSIDVKPAR